MKIKIYTDFIEEKDMYTIEGLAVIVLGVSFIRVYLVL